MPNTYFQFKQFLIHQEDSAMKVTTDACLFGAWVAEKLSNAEETCLDIGTGTGLLSLMLAQKATGVSTDAVEIDIAAANQARANVAASPWSQRIMVHEGDIKEYSSPHQYDLIISNPPFYKDDLKGPDARKNTAHHDEGLELPELFTVISKWLNPGGRFFLLLPYKQHYAIHAMLTKERLNVRHRVLVRQSVNHGYFRVMIEGGFAGNSTEAEQITELAIKDSNDQYTDAFTALLKDYYLKL